MRSRGNDHHGSVFREGLHTYDGLTVSNREAFVRAAILPIDDSKRKAARRNQLELLDRVADLLEAIRVQFQIIVRAR